MKQSTLDTLFEAALILGALFAAKALLDYLARRADRSQPAPAGATLYDV